MINFIFAPEGIWVDISLLLLRIGLFAIFLVHALPKIKKTEEVAAGMGASKPLVLTLGIAELVASVLMLFGFSTGIAAITISIVMLGAIFMKVFRWGAGFKESSKVGWEFDLILLIVAVSILLMGPGVISLQSYMLF
jgi:putative oxidoreductase